MFVKRTGRSPQRTSEYTLMTNNEKQTIKTYAKNKLHAHLSTSPCKEPDSLMINHKGFFLTIINPMGEQLLREGFLQTAFNVTVSAKQAAIQAADKIRMMNLSKSILPTCDIVCTLILDVEYLENPMEWNEENGLFFQWGQDFRGFLLPNEIKRMQHDKPTILDMLCIEQAGVCSNLWRLPEGLVWELKAEEF